MNIHKLVKYITIFSFLICVSSILYFSGSIKNQIKNIPEVGKFYSFLEKEEKPKVIINDIEIEVDIARTSKDMAKGLSGRKKLGKNEGMLFVFENKSIPSFWMKDMNFAIDIIWIADGKIVGIEKNVPNLEKGVPDSNLPIYYPPTAINHVLEVNAGFCEKNNFELDNGVNLSNINTNDK